MRPQKGAGGVRPSLLPWMQAPCPEGHHESLIIYDEPSRVLRPASWLVSVLYTLWLPFFRAYRGFFRWATGWRAKDFPSGWPSPAVDGGEDWRLLFLEFCHGPHLLSLRLEVGKAQKTRPSSLSACFLLFFFFNKYIHFLSANNLQSAAGNETEFWFPWRSCSH